jgi:S1-C subfamily serine protease
MTESLRSLSDSLAATVARVAASVARVNGRRRAPSSGVGWTPGIVLTANHTLETDDDVEVTLPDGRSMAASLVGRDPSTDVAALRLAEPALPVVPWKDATGLQAGHLVLGVSRPGRATRAGLGIVSAFVDGWRSPAGGRLDCYLETTLARHPGFSGSLLLDADGNAVGLNTSGLLRGASLAVATPSLRRVVTRLMEHGEIRRGFLGVGTYPVRLPLPLAQSLGQTTGLLVVSVEPESPASRAGLLLGDALIRLEGRPIAHAGELLPLLDEDRIGAEMEAQVVRAGEIKDVRITVGARSARPATA